MTMHTMVVQLISLMVCVAAFGINCGHAATFDVMSYGAIGDGIHDDTQAFEQAWEVVCSNVDPLSTLQVPNGRTFLLSPLKFQGPCKSSIIHVEVLGTLIAHNQIGAWEGCEDDSWIYFSGIDGLIMDGTGTIHGQGSSWWENVDNHGIQNNGNYKECDRPTALHFHRCDGLQLRGLKHVDSPRSQISIDHCNGADISGLQIIAPEKSPNTDGIDVSSSTNVHISNSIIQTGDDCIAINTGSFDILITDISCGPGHGISVGSLGEHGSYAAVERVHVKSCQFHGTQNGLRIKTWPGGSGYARQIRFEDITVTNVKNPVIIDQFYCDGEFHCQDKSSAVYVSDVTYEGVTGSSIKEEAIKLECSKYQGCTNIVMRDINITSAVPGAKIYASCQNVHGESSSTSPTVSCLT